MELAATWVSIALFNQASRITIFPLVSITTSFDDEEDTIAGRASIKAAEKGSNDDDMLEDMEKGEAGKKAKNLEKSSSKKTENEVAETNKNLEKVEDLEDSEETEYASTETSAGKECMQENTIEDMENDADAKTNAKDAMLETGTNSFSLSLSLCMWSAKVRVLFIIKFRLWSQ